MSFSIARKTAIITGAASGVGLAIARRFVEQGANVMCADRYPDQLKLEADTNPDSLDVFVGDLTDYLTQNNLIAAAVDRFDRVDVLVNASRGIATVEDIDHRVAALDEMLDHNLRQHYGLSRLAARLFIDQDKSSIRENDLVGSIVNISSIAADRVHPSLVEYSVSCAGLHQLTRSLAAMLAPRRINVNAVAFGSVMSGRVQAALLEDPGLRDRLTMATPMDRIADAEEVAETVQFLVSSAARFITGQIITVDGGRTLLDTVADPVH